MLRINVRRLENKRIDYLPNIFYLMTFILISRVLFYKTLIPYNVYPDSYGYISFPFKDMLSLHFTSGRTLLYVCAIL